MKTTRLWRILAGVTALVALAGCSGMRIVDSDVSAFAAAASQRVAVPASYRYERLPSQQQVPQRDALEALVDAELAKVGMQRSDSAAQFSVQVDVRIFRDPQAPWDDPRYVGGYAVGVPVMTRYGPMVRYPSLSLQFDFPYYRREVSLIVRRLSDGQVAYESRAKHDGRWPDDAAVLPAMFQAALKDFPNPPQGLRHIAVEIPR